MVEGGPQFKGSLFEDADHSECKVIVKGCTTCGRPLRDDLGERKKVHLFTGF